MNNNPNLPPEPRVDVYIPQNYVEGQYTYSHHFIGTLIDISGGYLFIKQESAVEIDAFTPENEFPQSISYDAESIGRLHKIDLDKGAIIEFITDDEYKSAIASREKEVINSMQNSIKN